MVLWLIVLGVAIWLSLMVLAVILPIRPGIVRITGPFVCPSGSKMEVDTPVYSYHRPGEKAIIIRCMGPGIVKNVKIRALLVFWFLCLLVSLPVTVLLGILIYKLVESGKL